jgi:hypothetical protein
MKRGQPHRDGLRWRIRDIADDAVQLSDSVLAPASFSAVIEHPDWPANVLLYVCVSEEEGPRECGLRVLDDTCRHSLPAMLEIVRHTIAMPELLRFVTADAVATKVAHYFLEADQDLTEAQRERVLPERQRAVAAAADQTWDVAAPRRRRFVTRDLLREVAQTYRRAVERGQPPTQAVQEHFSVSHSTAARWVGEARRLKELGPARKGASGEDPQRGQQ